MNQDDRLWIEVAMEELSERIKRANREVYNSLSLEEYDRNESIFNERRRVAVAGTLAEAARLTGGGRILDVGTGTGNIPRLAGRHFKSVFAVDIGDKLLRQVKTRLPSCHLAAADAERLPFAAGSFDCVSCYALLHHLLEHRALFAECHRVLRSGGVLYTDHDPNYFFNRFYHVYYSLRFAGRHGFGTDAGDLAEYHNVFSPGINPVELRRTLLGIGFNEVVIRYRVTDNRSWGGLKGACAAVIRGFARVLPLKSLNTHFSLFAVK